MGSLTKLMKGCKPEVFYLLLVEHLLLQLLNHLALVVDLIILQQQTDTWNRNSSLTALCITYTGKEQTLSTCLLSVPSSITAIVFKLALERSAVVLILVNTKSQYINMDMIK